MYHLVVVYSQNKKILQQKVIGGVTLNHLAWAAQVGGTDKSCNAAIQHFLTRCRTDRVVIRGLVLVLSSIS